MRADLSKLLRRRRGHFEFESGHHGAQWLELERLCLHPARLQPLVHELAEKIADTKPELICGPLVEGAFVGLLVALELDLEFAYTERYVEPGHPVLFPVRYAVPNALRAQLTGRRVAIVNDVINAGSAVAGTLQDLNSCEAEVVSIGTILVVGPGTEALADNAGVPLLRLETELQPLYEPCDCPQCAEAVQLTPHPGT